MHAARHLLLLVLVASSFLFFIDGAFRGPGLLVALAGRPLAVGPGGAPVAGQTLRFLSDVSRVGLSI